MADWSADFLAYLASISSGTLVAGTNLFRASLPTQHPPDTLAVVVTPTQGPAPDQLVGLRYPRVQVLVRARAFAAAHAEALRLYGQLRNLGPVRIGSSPYTLVQSVRALQDPYPIGKDENECWRVVCNFQLELLAP